MTDFLLELRSEEIPARMQAGARVALEKLFREQMAAAGVTLGAVQVWSTPRRLAIIARDLPLATAAVSEEVKGPKTGAPPQALEGFLRKTGLTQEQLTERDGIYFAVTEKPGRATKQMLAEAIPAIIRAFPWPKSQRWGAASISTEALRWVRPLSGIVALLGEDLVHCEIGGVTSGYATMGHRFHHHGPITIGSAADYQEKLRACHVIVDHAEREALIRTKAAAAAQAAGLVLVEDEGLVIENAGLTEWPVPLLGRFDEEYLEVPPEVIQLTARTNQKYFICTNPPRHGEVADAKRLTEGAQPSASDTFDGEAGPLRPSGAPPRAGEDFSLANAFICTANIEAADHGEAIVAGNRKVLAARLSDARFFWEQDRKHTLADQAKKLERITFHEKLGSVADKVERVAKLARWLVEEGIVTSSPKRGGGPAKLVEGHAPDLLPSHGQDNPPVPLHHPADGPPPRAGEDLADMAELAARLCKADLVTEMVGEFPELQGLMGGYYARAEGLPDAVADAIRDHYKPGGQGDDVPTAPVTVAVSLADKLDTLLGFFLIDEKPNGSKDPYALRRAMLGIIRIILENEMRVELTWPVQHAMVLNIIGLAARKFIPANDVYERIGNAATESIRQRLIEIGQLANDAEQERLIKLGLQTSRELGGLLIDRLKVQQKEAGVRHDLIDAVFALGGEDDLVRLLARVHALQAFIGTEDGTNLLAGYKRAANILKKEEFASGAVNPSPEPAEQALIDALAAAAPKAAAAVDSEDFAGAMAALATLRAPIDAFFETVTVNDADPVIRAARLGLLDQFRVAVHKVADFSRIEG